MECSDSVLQDNLKQPVAQPQRGDLRQVDAVVVSFNTCTLTLRCVEALCADSSVNRVCVVDNGSKDGSQEALIERSCRQHDEGGAPALQIECICKNRGFGGANNLGVGATESEFVALVNSDAFVLSGAIETMRDYLKAHPHVGVVGPRLLNTDGTFQESRFPFPTPLRAWFENLGFTRLRRSFKDSRPPYAGPVDWLSGACLLIRRSGWIESGGFDESFFLYSEETDLQKRIRSAGWEIHWVPEAIVTHVGGGSGGSCRTEVREHFFEGVDRYFLKHFGKLGAVLLRGATCVGACLRWIEACLLLRVPKQREAAWLLKRQIGRPFPALHTPSGRGL